MRAGLEKTILHIFTMVYNMKQCSFLFLAHGLDTTAVQPKAEHFITHNQFIQLES